MRIVHFVRVAPHRSGLYESTRELAQAARQLGHDAVMVDVHTKGRMRGQDRGVPVVTYGEIGKADVYILHSLVPEPLFSDRVPVVVLLHGQPEYCMASEDSEPGQAPVSTLMGYFNSPHVAGAVTMWPRHQPFWQALSRKKPVLLIQAPVDLERNDPDGKRYSFKDGGEYNVVFCDSWRWMKLPSQIIAAFRILWKDLGRKDVKLHMYGLPSGRRETFWRHVLTELVQDGCQFVGELDHIVPDLPDVFRACDLVVTPEADESRIVREAAACGAQILAPHGQELATHRTNMGNAGDVAMAIDEILQQKQEPSRQPSVLDRSLTTVGAAWIDALKQLMGAPCLQT